jgi:hypothetical protein
MNNANDTYKNENLQIKSNQTWVPNAERTQSLTHPSPRDAAKKARKQINQVI